MHDILNQLYIAREAMNAGYQGSCSQALDKAIEMVKDKFVREEVDPIQDLYRRVNRLEDKVLG